MHVLQNHTWAARVLPLPRHFRGFRAARFRFVQARGRLGDSAEATGTRKTGRRSKQERDVEFSSRRRFDDTLPQLSLAIGCSQHKVALIGSIVRDVLSIS